MCSGPMSMTPVDGDGMFARRQHGQGFCLSSVAADVEQMPGLRAAQLRPAGTDQRPGALGPEFRSEEDAERGIGRAAALEKLDGEVEVDVDAGRQGRRVARPRTRRARAPPRASARCARSRFRRGGQALPQTSGFTFRRRLVHRRFGEEARSDLPLRGDSRIRGPAYVQTKESPGRGQGRDARDGAAIGRPRSRC